MAAFSNAAGALVATKLGAMETDFTQIDVRRLCTAELGDKPHFPQIIG
tara:strand:+ start:930 stop:1073 length:144 start_codon:yes stop_codon:yes gene_type:complete